MFNNHCKLSKTNNDREKREEHYLLTRNHRDQSRNDDKIEEKKIIKNVVFASEIRHSTVSFFLSY